MKQVADKKQSHLQDWKKVLARYCATEQTDQIQYRIKAIQRLIDAEESKQ